MSVFSIRAAKYMVGAAIVVGVLMLGVHLSNKSTRMLRAGSEMAVIMDIVSFAEDNKLRMPNDWNEFETWSAIRPNNSHWKAENLKNLYSLPWGKPLVDLNLTNGVLIRILDSSRCPISQESANNYMRCFASAALMTTNALPSKENRY